ncbi:hypothetical protein KJ781_01880 [Patescibacteria group bacterium]|nr:hypothetical protein [Patescibacteria group bacterium]
MFRLLRGVIPSRTVILSLPLASRAQLLDIVRRDMDDTSLEDECLHAFWLLHSGRTLREVCPDDDAVLDAGTLIEAAYDDMDATVTSGCFLPRTAKVLEDFIMTALLTVRDVSVRVEDSTDPCAKGLLSPDVPLLLCFVSRDAVSAEQTA